MTLALIDSGSFFEGQRYLTSDIAVYVYFIEDSYGRFGQVITQGDSYIFFTPGGVKCRRFSATPLQVLSKEVGKNYFLYISEQAIPSSNEPYLPEGLDGSTAILGNFTSVSDGFWSYRGQANNAAEALTSDDYNTYLYLPFQDISIIQPVYFSVPLSFGQDPRLQRVLSANLEYYMNISGNKSTFVSLKVGDETRLFQNTWNISSGWYRVASSVSGTLDIELVGVV